MSVTIFPQAGDDLAEGALAALLKLTAENYVESGFDVSAGAGLNAGVSAGTAFIDGYYVNENASQAVPLTDSATNFIYLSSTGTLSANTTGINAAPTTSICIGQAITSGGAVTGVSSRAPRQHRHSRKQARPGVSIGGGAAYAITMEVDTSIPTFLRILAAFSGRWGGSMNNTSYKEVLIYAGISSDVLYQNSQVALHAGGTNPANIIFTLAATGSNNRFTLTISNTAGTGSDGGGVYLEVVSDARVTIHN